MHAQKQDGNGHRGDNEELMAYHRMKGHRDVGVQKNAIEQVVQSLVEAGLFESFDEFASIALERGYDPSYIVAGIYTFSAGSSQDDIVDVVMTGGGTASIILLQRPLSRAGSNMEVIIMKKILGRTTDRKSVV